MNNLRIEQTYPKIGIETNNSKIQIQSRTSRVNLQQERGTIEIDKELPRVLIDQRECFATAGLKSILEIPREAAQDGRLQALKYIAKKSQDGDFLANLRYKGNAIAEIARRGSFHENEFNIDLIPKVLPTTEVTGYIKMNFKPGKVSTSVEEGYVDINFSKPQTRIYLLQKPSINIQYIGNNIDVKI